MIKKLEIYDSNIDETKEYEKYYGRLFRNIETSQPRPTNEFNFNFGVAGELIKHTDINIMIQKLKEEYITRINFFKSNHFFDIDNDNLDEFGGNQIKNKQPKSNNPNLEHYTETDIQLANKIKSKFSVNDVIYRGAIISPYPTTITIKDGTEVLGTLYGEKITINEMKFYLDLEHKKPFCLGQWKIQSDPAIGLSTMSAKVISYYV